MGTLLPAPIVSALLLGALILGARGDCPDRCDCSSSFYDNELDMKCTIKNMTINVAINDDKTEVIIKFDKHENQLVEIQRFSIEDLPQLDMNPSDGIRIMWDSCLMPPSFENAASRFGAKFIEELYIDYAPESAIFTSETVKGLERVKKLVIYSNNNNESIPSEAFRSMPLLEKFSIGDCDNLILRAGDFDSAPNLTYLEMRNSKIPHLPSGIFRSLKKLKKLNIFKNELQDLTEEQLSGLDTLEQLDISENKLLSLKGLSNVPQSRAIAASKNFLEELPSLSHLLRLELIRIRQNNVTLRLNSTALAWLPNLTTVELATSGIIDLPIDFLKGSPAVKTLVLQGNHIAFLHDGVFKDQKSLEKLDLSGNRLAQLSANVFKTLHALIELNLDNNQLTALPPKFISELVNLKILRIGKNQLQAIYREHINVDTLEEIYLDHNMIATDHEADPHLSDYVILGGAFSMLTQLKVLDLGHNKLTEIPNGLENSAVFLEDYNLSYNNIEQVLWTNYVSSMAKIDLRHNKIQGIFLSAVAVNGSYTNEPNHKRSVMMLDDNPFKCDCHLYQFARRLHGYRSIVTNEADFEVNDAKCASPPKLANKPIRNVPLNEFVCEFTTQLCEGLDCTCLYRTDKKALEMTCNTPPANVPSSEELQNSYFDLKLIKKPLNLNLPQEIRSLSLSGLGLTNMPPGGLPKNLKELDLTNNQFSSIPPKLFENNNTRLKISNNPIKCDCWHIEDVLLIKENWRNIDDYNEVNCTDGQYVRDRTEAELCSTWRASVIGGVLAMLGLVTAVIAILILKYSFEIKTWLYTRGMFARWFVIDDDDRKYDAFVSFCHKDEDFVKENLIPGLENIPQPYKLCIHYRDWMPGEFITTQIAQSVADSRRTIIVVSKNFLESQWARAEFRTANMTAIKERKTRVIAILLEDVNSHKDLDPELKNYLSTNTYLKWGDPWFWDKLRYALPHRKEDIRSRRKAANVRVNEASKVMGICGLDTRLTSDGVIINAAALAVPENKKGEEINFDMRKLSNLRSVSDMKPIQV